MDSEYTIPKTITEKYQGNFTVTFDTISNSDISNVKIECSKNNGLEVYDGILRLPASNIALLLFEDLKKKKKKVNSINVLINTNPNGKISYDFNVSDLEAVSDMKFLFYEIIEKISLNDYDKINRMFSEKAELNSQKFKDYLDQYKQFGKIQSSSLEGFGIMKSADPSKTPLINFLGIIQCEKGDIPIKIFINKKTNDLISVSYEWFE